MTQIHSNWQSKQSAVNEAREFVRRHSYGTLVTVNHGNHDFNAYPSGQVEYYSDNDDNEASLLFIRVDMSSAFRNIHLGSPSSIAIRTGDSPNAVSPLHMANSHRIILYGEFDDYEPTQNEQNRYFKLHPDARSWRPGHPGFHQTFWTKFTITGIYYIGGFGGEHYIGKLSVQEYRAVRSTENEKTALLGGCEEEENTFWLKRLIMCIWSHWA